MTKIIIIAVVALIIFLLVLPFELKIELKRKRLLNAFWIRSCTGKDWLSRFPGCSKETIRDFLTVFVDAFLFNNKKRLKFKPDDKVMDIYSSLYPEKGWADALELEFFAKNLKSKYGVDLYAVTNESITLGEIFEITQKTSQQVNRGDRE